MSDLEILKNISTVATVGIPPLQIPIDRHRFPQQEAMVCGVEVYIGPEGVFHDKNGVVHGAFKSDSESVFVNCAASEDGVVPDEAIVRRVPERNYGWLHEIKPLRRGPYPRDAAGVKEPGWRFMGWFGVSTVVKDHTGQYAEQIKNAAAGPTENFRAIQRLEARVVELTNQVSVLGARNKELAEQLAAEKAHVRVLQGPPVPAGFTIKEQPLPPAPEPAAPAAPALSPSLAAIAAAVAPKEPEVKADPEATGPQHQQPRNPSRRH